LKKVTFFGLQGQKITQREVEMVEQNEDIETTLVYMLKDIKRRGLSPVEKFNLELKEDPTP